MYSSEPPPEVKTPLGQDSSVEEDWVGWKVAARSERLVSWSSGMLRPSLRVVSRYFIMGIS